MQHALPILSTLAGVAAAEERVAAALSRARVRPSSPSLFLLEVR